MKRRGISLNELLVSISLVAVLLPMCGKLLWTLGQGQRAQMRWSDRNRELMRLAMQLKKDGLDAERFSSAPQPEFKQRLGDVVQYSQSPQGLQRTVFRKGERSQGDTFYLGRESRLAFEADEFSQRVIASVWSRAPNDVETEQLRLLLPTPFQVQEEQP